jgi:hypothetical protein
MCQIFGLLHKSKVGTSTFSFSFPDKYQISKVPKVQTNFFSTIPSTAMEMDFIVNFCEWKLDAGGITQNKFPVGCSQKSFNVCLENVRNAVQSIIFEKKTMFLMNFLDIL